VNKQCFADGDAAGSSGVTGAAPRAVDPVVRIESTGARPIDAMSAWATTGGPGTASLVASGRVARMRVLRNLQLEPSHAVDTCVQRITPPRRPAPADMLSRGCCTRSAHFPTAPDGLNPEARTR
jgi:hypothetical protein